VEKGCDKTVPAQIMGGLSSEKPVLPLITGPMMPGSNRGVRIGACTDCRNNWAAFRAGGIDIEEISAINEELAPTVRLLFHAFQYQLSKPLTHPRQAHAA
jgi:dihydroxy-acid dehydratase